METSEREAQSYSSILKSSSLVGGAEFVRILISLVRVKAAAIFLGPEGIGLIGLLSSSTGMLGVFADLGLSLSATRDVSKAHGEKDAGRLSRIAKVLRRVSLLTGLAGGLMAILLSGILSRWTFGTTDYSTAIAILGLTIFFGQVSAAQEVLLIGTRRVSGLAAQSVLGALGGAVASIILYAVFGKQGIVPALLVTALSGLIFSWWFARRVPLVTVEVDFKTTVRTGLGFIRLGLVVMYVSLLAAFVAWATQAYLANTFGVSANGIYYCAWALSGQFAVFILSAMGVDFFPRLSRASSDNLLMARLVNEQTEIGILLALPGLIATFVFAPFIVRIFYSAEFATAENLLPWFVIGMFFKVIHWPMDYIQYSLGAGRWIVISQTTLSGVHLILIIVLTNYMGLIGCAIAFVLMNLLTVILIRFIVQRLTGFRWSANVAWLMTVSGLAVILAFAIARFLNSQMVIFAGGVLTLACGFMCLRGLLYRLGPEHWASRSFRRVPYLAPKSKP